MIFMWVPLLSAWHRVSAPKWCFFHDCIFWQPASESWPLPSALLYLISSLNHHPPSHPQAQKLVTCSLWTWNLCGLTLYLAQCLERSLAQSKHVQYASRPFLMGSLREIVFCSPSPPVLPPPHQPTMEGLPVLPKMFPGPWQQEPWCTG